MYVKRVLGFGVVAFLSSIVRPYHGFVFFLVIVLAIGGCAKFQEFREKSFLRDNLDGNPELFFTRTLWSRSVGVEFEGDYPNLTPLIIDHSVVVCDHFGSCSSLVLEDGKTLWQIDLKQTLSAAVGGDAHVLFVGTQKGVLIALSAKDGSILWKLKLSNARITALSDIFRGQIFVRSFAGDIVAVSIKKRTVLWKQKEDLPPLMFLGMSAPIGLGNIVIVGGSAGRLLVFDRRKGSLQKELDVATALGSKKIDVANDIDAPLILREGVIYAVSANSGAMGISLEGGGVLWFSKTATLFQQGIGDRALYMVNMDLEIVAIDRRNGRVLWENEEVPVVQTGLVAKMSRFLAIGDGEGRIHLLSAKSGKWLGSDEFSSSPIVSIQPIRENMALVYDKGARLSLVKIAKTLESPSSFRAPWK